MRPGQLTPNALESAILLRIAAQLAISDVHVLRREYTVVGSFTNFSHPDVKADAATSMVDLPGIIAVAGVTNGLGAHLMLRGGRPDCLEIYTFGDDKWDALSHQAGHKGKPPDPVAAAIRDQAADNAADPGHPADHQHHQRRGEPDQHAAHKGGNWVERRHP